MSVHHTPTPWTVQSVPAMYGSFTIKEWQERERSVLRGFACDKAEFPASVKDEREANRRLIASAPELLAALIEARKLAVAAICAGVDLPGFIVEDHVTIKRLDAAIAKATGAAQ